jgi:hypothetical protein
MSTQTGKISIQFKKNKKGNLQHKNISIAVSDSQILYFDSIPDKKLPEKQISVSLLDSIGSITQECKLGMLSSSWMNNSRS